MNDLDASAPRSGLEVAIIGMAGRFPGAKNTATLWQNLRDGIASVSHFTDQELIASGVDPALLADANYVRARAVLDDVTLFDAAFFSYTPREAELMDPQQRLFMECAWEALEGAGYTPETYAGSIGVYASASMSGYLFHLFPHGHLLQSAADMSALLGADKDFLSTRVSYKLNLRGPSLVVQSACSSSLVAVHLACQGLLSGDCDMALAGGVTVNVPHRAGYLYQEGGIASPDGCCRAFDAKAQGTVGGNGVGIVVLKRLDDALAYDDSILAVIKGSAINNDGALKIGYTAPSIDGQAEAIRAAHIAAGVEAGSITYVEAHGTGTPLGDPIEVAALTRAFRASTDAKGYCAIGSVKTNIGHLDAAAGITGLIKTVLALQHKLIPPSLYFTQPNPQIDFANSPFYVNARLSPWQAGSVPRRAGVSSLGIGGTNAHVVLEEAPPMPASESSRPWQALVWSAKTATVLEASTTQLMAHLRQHPDIDLADCAYTLQVGRKAFQHRCLLVCNSLADAVTALETQPASRVLTNIVKEHEPVVAFMFSGQGSQYVNMGRELYDAEPMFREQVDRCAEWLIPNLGFDVRQVLYPGQEQVQTATEQLNQTALAQPVFFIIEYALARLWMAWGVRPQAMIGHSIGEYVAACLAGVFSWQDALRLVVARGRLMQQLPGGAMLALPLAEREVEAWLGEHVSLAAINGPSRCVVAGSADAIEHLQEQLAAQGIEGRRLPVSHAFHSHLMEPALEPFVALLSSVPLRVPSIPYVSNVTGTWITAAEATDGRYWAQHMRQTVRFADGIRLLLADPARLLLELGPGQVLSILARQHPERTPEQFVLPTLRDASTHTADTRLLWQALGQLWLEGVPVDWQAVHAGERRRRIPLPTYPFERQHYWIARPEHTPPAKAEHSSVADVRDPSGWCYLPSWKRTMPLDSLGTSLETSAHWLVFTDAGGFGAALVRRLRQQGQRVTVVSAGEHFARHGEGMYAVNAAQRSDYVDLLRELHNRNELPSQILHCWSITPRTSMPPAIESFEASQQTGFFSVLSLLQALEDRYADTHLALTVVSNHLHDVTGEEEFRPEKATLLSLCRVISQEYAHITSRSVDIPPAEDHASWDDTWLDRLISEAVLPAPDTVVAYRGPHRWVPSYEPVRWSRGVERPLLLRERGVYLITGGLGGIGMALAKYLARTVRARLALVSRSPMPPREAWEQWLTDEARQAAQTAASGEPHGIVATAGDAQRLRDRLRTLLDLEGSGAEVLILDADVTDPIRMQAVHDQAMERFGAIHGVIHAAGVTGGGLIGLKTLEATRLEFAPKVQGTLVLDALFRTVKLDFFMLCSSLAAMIGGLGQVAYSAANAFMDAFAHYNAGTGGTYTVSVNWDRWQNVGMAAHLDARARAWAIDAVYTAGMTASEGQEVFHHILSQRSLPQIVVSTEDFRIKSQASDALTVASILGKSIRLRQGEETHPRPPLTKAYIPPTNGREQALAAIWQEVLGLDRVGLHDDFFELGGESLLALQILNRVRSFMQVDLSLQRFLETPTIAGLSAWMEQTTGDATDVTTSPLLPLPRDRYRATQLPHDSET